MVAERKRLEEERSGRAAWKKWGPYLSERQWGTVREDYSADGCAWEYFSHDQARSRAYRWGEDGLAGFSDDKAVLCFSLALWNGADPILKERLFGLTNSEGNHGEDVKEYYFYLDSTPTHSYMKYLYKYPQAAFPYDDLVATNRARDRSQPEYELLDTGVFDHDRYFDVFVEYAKESAEEILVQITAHNRGAAPATLHLVPTLWFRNTWSAAAAERPRLNAAASAKGSVAIAAHDARLGERALVCEGAPELLFTENETNARRLFGQPNAAAFVKDGINDCVVAGARTAVNPQQIGTKAAAHYTCKIAPGAASTVRLRLSGKPRPRPFGKGFDTVVATRRREADEFYASVTPPSVQGTDAAQVLRQSMAGMLWSKQYYNFDLGSWLGEHGAHPLLHGKDAAVRNRDWIHMVNDDIISMPDKWEYPWYAAWDLAFHCIALATVDLDFAKQQLALVLGEVYLHPNGQIPAYEWNFNDVNPPVHAWGALNLFRAEKQQRGQGDFAFLRATFQKLLLNFTWWVNRKDSRGRNVFEGGFLGLDNISVFDRSAALPMGGSLEQADGTAWMAFYSQCMLAIALELAEQDEMYEDMALKFAEHFFWIAAAMDRVSNNGDEMWDEQDGFFYDVLRLPDGQAHRLKVRSLVGLLPLCAVSVIEPDSLRRFPRLLQRMRRFLRAHPGVTANIASPEKRGLGGRLLMSILDERKLRLILARMLDENEFLAPHGLRSLSRHHRDHPYVFSLQGQEYCVEYQPAESNAGTFGGNSNWRGPIWFPTNMVLLRALLLLYMYYGDDFTVECPTGSGRQMNLYEITQEIGRRLISIFARDADGRRPVFGATEKFQRDPHWRDHLLFYEYFHGDNGAGIGASHQTGWTGIAGSLVQLFGFMTPELVLEGGAGGLRYQPKAAR